MTTGQFPQRRETDEEALARVQKIYYANMKNSPDYVPKEKLTVPIELRKHRDLSKSNGHT